MRRTAVALSLVVLAAVSATLATTAIVASPAHAAREYDIGDHDTLLMLTPTELAEFYNVLSFPTVNCNLLPGMGGNIVQSVAGKLSSEVSTLNDLCSLYAKERWIFNEQVKWAMGQALNQEQWIGPVCFPLVIDAVGPVDVWGIGNVHWRGAKLRTAIGADGGDVFWVPLNTVEQFENRDDKSHPSLPIRCTDYQPAQQIPLPEEIQNTATPPTTPPTLPPGTPLPDPVTDPDYNPQPVQNDSPTPPTDGSGGYGNINTQPVVG